MKKTMIGVHKRREDVRNLGCHSKFRICCTLLKTRYPDTKKSVCVRMISDTGRWGAF